MNATGNDLLQAILDDPASDERRLIYADWLDDQGEEERAEFVRVQIELEKWNPPEIAELPWLKELRRRERELLPNQRERFESAMTANMPLPSAAGTKLLFLLESAVFRRGFVDEVRCRLVDWMQHGPAIVACQPVTRVVVTDREPRRIVNNGLRHNFWLWQGHQYDGRRYGFRIEWQIFELMKNDGKWINHEELDIGPFENLYYSTQQIALDALSAACVRWAKNNHRMRT